MASHDDDTMPEETQGYKLSQPKQSLAEYQQMGRCSLFPWVSWFDVLWYARRMAFGYVVCRLVIWHRHGMMRVMLR
jgi:hypothetical protein